MRLRMGALGSPLYRRYWFGSLASVGGTQLLFMGQGWLVYELSGSPFDLGLLGAAASIPAILMTLFGGVLADRWDKRRLLLGTSLTVAVLLLILAMLDATGVVEVWHVIIIAGLFGLVSGLEWPSRQAFFPSLIEPEQMMSAVALNSMLWQGSRMIMPAIGGVIIAVSDTWVIFAAGAAGFVAMFLVLLTLEVGQAISSKRVSFQHFVEGMKFIAGTRLFWVLILLTWLSMFFGTSYIQLMPAFAELLGASEEGFGYLVSTSGVGAVTGTLLVIPLQNARRLGRIMLSGTFLFCVTLFGLALVTGFAEQISSAFAWTLLFVFLTNLFSSVFLISSMTVLQMRVPNELRGRVMGLHGIAFSLISLGALFGGTVASAFSPPVALAVGAAIIVLAVAWVAFTQGEIRELDGRQQAKVLRRVPA